MLLIDNCLLERQGGWRGGRERGEKGEREREEGWCTRGRDGGERWATGGKGGKNKRGGAGGLERWSEIFFFFFSTFRD